MLIDEPGEPFDGHDRAFDRNSTLGCCGARLGIGFESSLGLLEPTLEKCLAFVEARIANFELLPPRRQTRRSRLELRAQRAARPRRFRFSSLVGLEGRHQSFELGDANPLTRDPLGGLGDAHFERLELSCDLTSLALGARQRLGARGERGVVLVESAGELVLELPCGLQLDFGPRYHLVASSHLRLCGGEPLGRLVERRGSCAAPRSADAPAAGAEAITVCGDHDRGRMRHGDVERRREVLGTHGTGQHDVEQPFDGGVAPANVRAHGIATGRDGLQRQAGRRCGTGEAECDHGAVHVRGTQRLEGSSAGGRVVDDDGQQRIAQRRLDRRFPTVVDLDDVEQGAQCSFDAGQMLGAGPGASGFERHRQRLGTGLPARKLLRRRLATLGGHLGRSFGREASRFRGLHLGDQGCFGLVGHLAEDLQPNELLIEPLVALTQRLETSLETTGFGLGTSESVLHRPQLAAHLGRSAGRRGGRCHVVDGGERLATVLGEALFLAGEPLGSRTEQLQLVGDGGEVVAKAGRIGLEVRDDTAVHQLATVALEGTTSLHHDRSDATCTLAKLLDVHHLVAEVGVAASSELGFGGEHRSVELRQFGAEHRLGAIEVHLVAHQRRETGAKCCDLATGEKPLQRRELGDEIAVPSRCLRLTFEGTELATHFAQQVLHAQQAGLGGVEASLALLLSPTELEHACCFFDDRPAILGTGVQHGVDLALAHDHVLLATDSGVAEQFLHVEQTAVHAVDRILALSRAEQRSGDRDLGELDRQDARGVVEGERDLGPAERRPFRRPCEDDVVHLLAAHRAGGLRTEHPRDGIDDVRLSGAVGTDHHRDARFELQRGGVGERLESFEGE